MEEVGMYPLSQSRNADEFGLEKMRIIEHA
jgi:hypothetical protein